MYFNRMVLFIGYCKTTKQGYALLDEKVVKLIPIKEVKLFLKQIPFVKEEKGNLYVNSEIQYPKYSEHFPKNEKGRVHMAPYSFYDKFEKSILRKHPAFEYQEGALYEQMDKKQRTHVTKIELR